MSASAFLKFNIIRSRLAAFFGSGRVLHQARFAKTHELTRLYSQNLDGPHLLLGEAEFGHILRVAATPQRPELGNMLVVGRTRSGKGLLAISQILTWPESLVINDIKGELFAKTAGARSLRGPVFVFDPTGCGSRFDPFLGRVSEEELTSAARSLLHQPGDGQNSIFTTRAMNMATQIFQAAVLQNQPLLPYLQQMVYAGPVDTARHLNRLSESVNRYPNLATRFLDKRLAGMERRNFDDRFFADAWSTLTNRLSGLLTDTLLRSIAGSDFTALDLLRGITDPRTGKWAPVTVYLRWPERSLEALSPLVRLVWNALIEEIAHIYDTAPDLARLFKVLLLVDEAGRAPVPSLAHHITTAAGRGMTIWMALQSLSQLQAEYGQDRAETIKDNCDTQLYYRPANHDGARRLREWLGDESGFAQSRTLRAGAEASEGEHEQAVPLLSAQEIKMLPDDETICFHANLPPFMPRRMDFRRFPTLLRRTHMPAPRVSALPPLPKRQLPGVTDFTLDEEVQFVNPEEFSPSGSTNVYENQTDR